VSAVSAALFRAANLREMDYPFDAALASAMEFCQQAVIIVGQSVDDTDVWVRQQAGKYLGRVIVQHTQFVFDRGWQERWWKQAAALTDADWLMWLDCDEVIDPIYAPELRRLMENPELFAVRFPFVHFWGSQNWVATEFLKTNTRLGRRSAGFCMVNMCDDDNPSFAACAVQIRDLRNRETDAHAYRGKAIIDVDFPILHYSWCRSALAKNRIIARENSWYKAEDDGLRDGRMPQVQPFNYRMAEHRQSGYILPYQGKHPTILDRWFSDHAKEWADREREAQGRQELATQR